MTADDIRNASPFEGWNMTPETAPAMLAALPLPALFRAILTADLTVLDPSLPSPRNLGGLTFAEYRTALLAALDLCVTLVEFPQELRIFIQRLETPALKGMVSLKLLEIDRVESESDEEGQIFFFLREAIAELTRRSATNPN